MSLVVQKYGGTSVADVERIKRVAQRVVATAAAGTSVCVVVSAMGATTDTLLDLAREVSPNPHPREQDVLLTAGERISAALLAMAVNELGRDAVSFTGSQAGIVTDAAHGRARIVELRMQRIHDALERGSIVIVAGFQGVSRGSDITTLGRGGSDTTAVALAAALGATVCEIYTDVEGVFTADPRIVPTARKLTAVTYEEMLELAASGAKVLQLRSVEFARNHDVRLHVRSTFSQAEGTWIVDEEDPVLEKAIISGVAHTDCEPLFRAREIDAAKLFAQLADVSVNVDTILQVSSDEIVFSAPLEDRETCEQLLGSLGIEWSMRDDLGKVSLIGAGMKSHPGIAAKTFATLEGIGVESKVISTSPIKIACHVATADVPRGVTALHDAFELEL